MIVNNGRKLPVELTVNGKVVGEPVPGRGYVVVSLPSGDVELEATEISPTGERWRTYRQETHVESPFLATQPKAYVWNVNSEVAKYWIATVAYGTERDKPHPVREFVPESEVFELPEGLMHKLNGNFPSAEAIGDANTTRSMLWTDYHYQSERMNRTMKRQFSAETGKAMIERSRPDTGN